MHIWIVNPFDPLPGESLRPGRYAFIANMFSERGHKVTWWTSNFSHIDKKFRWKGTREKIINPNLTIRLLQTPSYKNNVSITRLYNHYIYGRRFETEAMKAKERPDIILASLPPIESADAAIKIGRKLKSKVVIDIQDLWPDVYLFILPKCLKPMGKILLYRLFQKANTIYRNADALMAVSADYLKRGIMVCRNTKPAMLLHLGIDLKFYDSHKQSHGFFLSKKEEEIWITYIGTLGKTYDLDTVLESAIHFLDDSNLKFILAGDGPEYPRLKKKMLEKNIYNTIFTGMLNYQDLVHLLGLSAVGLSAVGLSAYDTDAPQTFPNKVFDYFAAALPVINSIPGELQQLLEENQAGLQYEAGNARSLVHAIEAMLKDKEKRKEMGRNARKLVEERFDRNKEYLKLEKYFKDLILQHR